MLQSLHVNKYFSPHISFIETYNHLAVNICILDVIGNKSYLKVLNIRRMRLLISIQCKVKTQELPIWNLKLSLAALEVELQQTFLLVLWGLQSMRHHDFLFSENCSSACAYYDYETSPFLHSPAAALNAGWCRCSHQF